MQLRENILCGNYSFCVNISADYGEQLYTFGMKCKSADHGALVFEIMSPESISGITGTMDDNTSNITFDGHILAFEPLTDKQIAPISAPWILINSLKSGYIQGYSGKAQPQVILDDSYEDESLQLQVWLNDENKPVYAEIYWDERRVITMEITEFQVW